MGAVAARAGVGKPTLYRRYPTKAAVVFDAVFGRTKAKPIPDVEDVREQLRVAYSWAVDEFAAPEARAALPGLLADLSAHPELAQTVRAMVIDPEYERVRATLRQAQSRGQIRQNIDLTLVIDIFVGAALARSALLDHQVDHDFGQRLVDILVDGLAPRPS